MVLHRLVLLHYEKRGIAVDIPVWNPENCIQCNRCAYVCPHAVIRPVAMTELKKLLAAPEGMQMMDMTGMPGVQVRYRCIRSGLYRMWFLC